MGRYTAKMDEVGFLNSELVQDAVIRNIKIIGEAANNILRVAADFAAAHADIPWKIMYTMRNRVSHGYEEIDLEIVWRTIQGDLPVLHGLVQEAFASLQPPA
nr:HepT-like ribonuclease domain-containing protein [Simplicispira psychrophila]